MKKIFDRRKASHWLLASAIGLAVLALVLLLRRFNPTEYSFYPKCTLNQATGLHCPGCGATRAVGALAAGRLVDAIRYNPLLVLGGPVIAAFIFLKIKYEDQREANWNTFSICLLVVVVVFAIARNVPSPTRSILAPPTKISPENKPALEHSGARKVGGFIQLGKRNGATDHDMQKTPGSPFRVRLVRV